MSALTISQDALDALVARLVDEKLTALLPALAEKYIRERIGQLSLEEAAPHLQCRNVAQLRAFCRQHGIPVRYFGPKKQFLKIADIEAAQEKHALRLPTAPTPTVVRRVPSLNHGGHSRTERDSLPTGSPVGGAPAGASKEYGEGEGSKAA